MAPVALLLGALVGASALDCQWGDSVVLTDCCPPKVVQALLAGTCQKGKDTNGECDDDVVDEACDTKDCLDFLANVNSNNDYYIYCKASPACFGLSETACLVSGDLVAEGAYAQCFGDEQSVSAARVPMRELRAGDHVLGADAANGDLVVSRVVLTEHGGTAGEQTSTRLLTLSHALGTLTVTPDHVVHIDGAYKAARFAAPGSTLRLAHGSVEIFSIKASVGGVVNPVTVSGTILAAGETGAPVVASTFSEWIAEEMLGSRVPLPFSLCNGLAYSLPAHAQQFHDDVVEQMFPTSGRALLPPLLALREVVPTALVPLAIVAFDLAFAATFLAYLAGCQPALVALSAVFIACRRCKAK